MKYILSRLYSFSSLHEMVPNISLQVIYVLVGKTNSLYFKVSNSASPFQVFELGHQMRAIRLGGSISMPQSTSCKGAQSSEGCEQGRGGSINRQFGWTCFFSAEHPFNGSG